jgi:hypothetical protein
MYCMQLHLYRSREYPLLCGAFHERLVELYDLPPIATLLKSLKSDVEWAGSAQVYYLENMREQNDKAVFQIRFSPSPHVKDLLALYLSIEASQVQNLTVQFPARGDRAASSKMIEALKSVVQTGHIPQSEIQFVAEGFMEMGQIRFIRETKLSGFVWVEGLGRYLHVSEDPSRVKEVQKGHKTL